MKPKSANYGKYYRISNNKEKFYGLIIQGNGKILIRNFGQQKS